jgi:voltage-gated potassium channel
LLLDCAYMTVVTLFTVGYTEVIPVTGIAEREIFTMGLLFIGMGTILYFVSTTAAFIIEGDLTEI